MSSNFKKVTIIAYKYNNAIGNIKRENSKIIGIIRSLVRAISAPLFSSDIFTVMSFETNIPITDNIIIKIYMTKKPEIPFFNVVLLISFSPEYCCKIKILNAATIPTIEANI